MDAVTKAPELKANCIMKNRICFLLNLMLLFILTLSQAQKTYELVSKKTVTVNNQLAAYLPANIKAIAAF
jgi:hypothetical protein